MTQADFASPNFSTEDLYSSIYEPRYRVKQNSVLPSDTIKPFFTVLTDQSKDTISFAIEAMENFEENERYGLFASESLDRMTREIAILAKIQKNYNVKGLQPYSFGTEKDDTPSPKKNILSKIWSAIVTAFHKIILTVGNWIRNILNVMGSAAMKGNIKFYELHSKGFSEKLSKHKDAKFKALIPEFNFSNFAKYLSSYITKISNGTDDINKKFEELKGLAEKLATTGKLNSVSAIWTMIKNRNPKKEFSTIISKISDALSFGIPKAKEKISSGSPNVLSAPTKFVNLIVYGTESPKISSTTVGTFFKNTTFNILSQETVNNMNNFVKSGRDVIKSLNKALNQVRAAARVAEAVSKKVYGKSEQGPVAAAIHKLSEYGILSRLYNSFAVGVLLNIYKEFLRQQGYAGSAARIVINGSKKAEKKSKPIKSMKTQVL